MCLAQGQQRSDVGEAPTRGPSVSSQHSTTEILSYCLHTPSMNMDVKDQVKMKTSSPTT